MLFLRQNQEMLRNCGMKGNRPGLEYQTPWNTDEKQFSETKC